MITFELEHCEDDGVLTIPIAICDYCGARIRASGKILWAMPSFPDGIAIGGRFQVEAQIFHLHADCCSPFLSERAKPNQNFVRTDLWEHLALLVSNVIPVNQRQRDRIFSTVEKVVEAERKS